MSERMRVKARIASSHKLDAYGGHKHPDGLLKLLAAAVRANQLPMVIDHDVTRPLDREVLDAKVIKLEDGHEAVEVLMDVDADGWAEYQAQLGEAGVPGGMSFTFSKPWAELFKEDSDVTARLSIYGDPEHFTDEAIEAAGERLIEVGPTKVGALYQFSSVTTCRIVIEYVHSAGGIEGAAILLQVAIQSASTAIVEAAKYLLSHRRKTSDGTPAIELRVVDAGSQRSFSVQTEDASAFERSVAALPGVVEALESAKWDDKRGLWLPVERRTRPVPAREDGSAEARPEDDEGE
jgi:hypothetical protein